MAIRDKSAPDGFPAVRSRLAGAVVCAGMASGVAISSAMWMSGRDFPRTPVWSPLDQLALPAPWDLVLLVVFFVMLGFGAVSGRRMVFGVCFGLALLLAAPDMQRWQPWFFQYMFMLGAVAFCGRKDSVGVMRVIVASTYIYSGLQKVHAAYFDGGMDFFLEPFGLVGSLSGMSYVAPFIELLVGVGLMFSRTRSFAALAAVGMHSFILVALSPFGQDWNMVVWPWNVAMILFILLLFFRAPDGTPFFAPAFSAYGFPVVVLFCVMPGFGLLGMWPSYLSASLYSENTKSALVYDGVEYVSVSELTTEEFETPAYPETAVFTNVAETACRRYGAKLGERPVMEISSRPGFVSGEREETLFYCSDLAP